MELAYAPQIGSANDTVSAITFDRQRDYYYVALTILVLAILLDNRVGETS
jgi:hypothetical protein